MPGHERAGLRLHLADGQRRAEQVQGGGPERPLPRGDHPAAAAGARLPEHGGLGAEAGQRAHGALRHHLPLPGQQQLRVGLARGGAGAARKAGPAGGAPRGRHRRGLGHPRVEARYGDSI